MFHGARWLYNRYPFYGAGGLDSFFDQTPLPLSKNPPMPYPHKTTEQAKEFDTSRTMSSIRGVRGKDTRHNETSKRTLYRVPSTIQASVINSQLNYQKL